MSLTPDVSTCLVIYVQTMDMVLQGIVKSQPGVAAVAAVLVVVVVVNISACGGIGRGEGPNMKTVQRNSYLKFLSL